MSTEEIKYTNAYIDSIKANLEYTDASLATLVKRYTDTTGIADASGRINDLVISDTSTFLKTAARGWAVWEVMDISLSFTY